MGIEDIITVRNQRGKIGNTCKTHESNCTGRNNCIAANVWKSDAEGVVTKYTSSAFSDYKKVSTFKTDNDGTITEYDFDSGKKVRSWKTDEDGKTFEYDKNGNKKTDKYMQTDEDGITRKFQKNLGAKDYSVTETYVPEKSGSLIKFDADGDYNSTYKSCGDREAFGKGLHEFPELKPMPLELGKPIPEIRAPKTKK